MADSLLQRLGPKRHALWLSPVAQPGALLPADFDAWCRAHAGATVTLWWAASGQQLLDIDPALPLTEAQRPGYARGVFAHYGGRAAEGAALALWRSGAHQGACLAPGLDVAALRAAARRHRVRLQRVAPLWLARLEQALQQRPAWRHEDKAVVLALEAELLVALALERGRLKSARLLRLDAATPAALAEAWRGLDWPGPVLLLGHGLSAGPTEVQTDSAPGPAWQVLGGLQAGTPDLGAAPRAVLESPPDFASTALPRSQRLGWWAAAVAGALCAAAGWDAWLSFDERAQARAREQQLQQRLAAWHTRDAPAPVGAPTPRPSRPWPSGLNHPWGALLAAVEASSDNGVRWLVLEHAAERPALRLAGVADDMPALMRVSERLSAQAGWRDVLPSRLQTLAPARPAAAAAAPPSPSPGRAPAPGLSFELSAQFVPGAGLQKAAP